jgi:hypothetical protein
MMRIWHNGADVVAALRSAIDAHESGHCPICGAPNGETWPDHEDDCPAHLLVTLMSMPPTSYTTGNAVLGAEVIRAGNPLVTVTLTDHPLAAARDAGPPPMPAREAAERERDEALEGEHYANGVADLAMKHRDAAEQARDAAVAETWEKAADICGGVRFGNAGIDALHALFIQRAAATRSAELEPRWAERHCGPECEICHPKDARDAGPPVGDWLSRVDGLVATLRGHFEAGLPQNAREAVVRFIGTCQDEWMTAPETRRRLEAAQARCEALIASVSHVTGRREGLDADIAAVRLLLDTVAALPAAPPPDLVALVREWQAARLALDCERSAVDGMVDQRFYSRLSSSDAALLAYPLAESPTSRSPTLAEDTDGGGA